MATPVCSISTAGISVPTYADCLAYVQGVFQGIYGGDIYLGPDCQDGQFCGILALALSDSNGMAEAVYNAFSPATAQGAGLSSVVKINGLTRLVPTNSTVDVTIVGVVGTVINAGVVADSENNVWYLPNTVTIPLAGQITVTATAAVAGAISIPALAINTSAQQGAIVTPQLGWQSVSNAAASSPGAPLETDAALRIRQSSSTMLPAIGVTQALVGALLALPGVTAVMPYVNTTNAPDANGVPGHCLSIVIQGGDDTQIANTVALQKGQGVGTYGSIVVQVVSTYGIPENIAFFRPTQVPISWSIPIKPLIGYTADVAAAIQTAIANFTNGLGSGNSVALTRAYPVAYLYGQPGSTSYEIVGQITASRSGAPLTPNDVAIAFNEIATCDPSLVNLTIVS